MSTFTIVFGIVLEVLAEQLGNKNKGKNPHWNTRIKLSLFVNDMILYKVKKIIENTHTHTHLLELIKEFSKILGNNINTKISCISIHNLKRKLRKQFYFQ